MSSSQQHAIERIDIADEINITAEKANLLKHAIAGLGHTGACRLREVSPLIDLANEIANRLQSLSAQVLPDQEPEREDSS